MSINVLTSTIAIASLSYVQPVFKANYVEIQVTAQVTMPDVLAVDIVTPTDLVALTVDKALQDTTEGFSDTLARAYSKHLTDTQYLGDTAVIGDIQPHRGATDSISNWTDTITGISFEKYLADTFELLDAATAVRLFQREFTDDFTVPDAQAKSIVPKPKIDAATISETKYFSVGKALSDSLTMIDNMDGNIQHHLFKTFSDAFSSSDTQVIDFNPNKADNITTLSSGVLSMQDYCDITYFLEDYVGLSRTFT